MRGKGHGPLDAASGDGLPKERYPGISLAIERAARPACRGASGSVDSRFVSDSLTGRPERPAAQALRDAFARVPFGLGGSLQMARLHSRYTRSTAKRNKKSLAEA